MALPRLNWTMIARGTLAAATAEAVMDFVYTNLNGVGGWTVAREQNGGVTEGIVLTPPTAAVSDMRIIMAGVASGSPTPTMRSPDTFTTGVLLCGIVKGVTSPGSLDWDAASPIADGTWSGYWRGFTCASSSNITVYYSGEAVMVVIDNNSNTTMRYVIAGAWCDPMSAVAGDCESSGRLYGMAMCGSVATTGINTAFWSASTANSTTANGMFTNANTNGNAHAGHFTPGAATWDQCAIVFANLGVTATTYFATPNNKRILWPILIARASDSRFAGRPREISMHIDGRHAATYLTTGSTVAGYSFGSGLTADADVMFLAAQDLS